MPGFSTLALGGTIVSPIRLNYDLSISASTTVALAYSNASIVDIVGLQVVIYNSSSSAITLTAGTQFTNYTSYPNYCSVLDQIVIPAFQSITLITTVIGQDYTIESISGKVSVDGGAAGNMIYQTAPNRTGFLAAGTPNYVLQSSGPNLPPYWNLLSTGNLSGGVAGSLVYQSAANTTSKSAVGTAFGPANGGIAAMTSATTNGWSNSAFNNGFSNTYSGGTLTVNNPRGWTFNCTAINSGGSGNLYTYMNANSIPQFDGDTYTIYNDNTINYALTIQNIQNPNGWGALVTSFAGGANVITLYPKESITFQRYNSSFLTIVSTTQCLKQTGIFNVTTQTSSAVGNTKLASNYDPAGWLQAFGTQIVPTVPGYYYIVANLSMTSNSGAFDIGTFSLQKNGVNIATTFNYKLSNNNITSTFYALVQMNGTTDYISLYHGLIINTSYYLTGNPSLITVSLIN